MDILILRFDAPLMSFGAPVVDRHGFIQPYPALSMMTGLLGNALGYDHSDADRLQRLQERLKYACRQDRRGQKIQDYQTVDLSQPFLSHDCGWTTLGVIEKREGGPASRGTHIRLRDYWADAVYTLSVTLEPTDEPPTLDDVEKALRFPQRPLFIGRKPCLPAETIFVERRKADTLLEALIESPLPERKDEREDARYRAWWPVRSDEPRPEDPRIREDIRLPAGDRRDWVNQIHTSQRWVAAGDIQLGNHGTTRS